MQQINVKRKSSGARGIGADILEGRHERSDIDEAADAASGGVSVSICGSRR